MLNSCLFRALTLAGVATTLSGQMRPVAIAPDTPLTNLPSHAIGPNDLLSISVYDAPELSRLVRVSADGFIRLPMLKQPVSVGGSMPAEVEAAVSSALKKEELLVAPVVTVTVADYSSRAINVSGAVHQPQTFQAAGPVRLLDALSKAGGLTDMAGSEILVSTPDGDLQHILVKQLLESDDLSTNIVLNGGEQIRVVEAGKAFVVGNVRKPGAFALRDSRQSTILQVLAMAEGLAPFASKQAYIYRRAESGERQECVVELDMILRRKHADVPVYADDILYIPENKGRKLGIAALERALMFGSTAGATALIYSNR